MSRNDPLQSRDDDTPRWFDRYPIAVAVGLSLLSLALRWVVGREWSDSLYGSQLMPDEQVYDLCARALAAGEPVGPILGFATTIPATVFSVVYRLLGHDVLAVRSLNTVLGAATCFASFFIGRALGNARIGLVACTVSCFCGPLALASVTVHKTALGLLFTGAGVALGVGLITNPTWLAAASSGGLLALAAHVRGNVLALLVVAPIAYWAVCRNTHPPRRLLTAAAAYVLGACLVLFPLAEDGPLGLPEPGFNLYFGNTLDNPTPYYVPARFAPAAPSMQAGGFVLKASIEEGRTLTTSEARAHYNHALLAQWRDDPRKALSKLVAKVSGSLNAWEPAHNHQPDVVSRHVRSLDLAFLGFGALFPFALLGAIRHRSSPQAHWLIALSIAYWATLMLFFTDVRLRAPLCLLLCPIAAAGLLSIRNLRDLARAAPILLVGLALTRIPTPGTDDLSTAENYHALFLLDTGELDQAWNHYLASRRAHGVDSESALLGLASVSTRDGDLDKALRLLKRFDESHYNASSRYEHLGATYVRQHAFTKAADAYERALAINPALLRVYPVLELVYRRISHPDRAADTKRRAEYAASFFPEAFRPAPRPPPP